MRKLFGALAVLAAALFVSGAAQARLVINVDKSTQRMFVSVNGTPAYAWEVSTGRVNFGTPSGVFAPQRLARTWFSSKYYNSPMPYSIFFHKGYAIHGSNEISKLGGPASHGCIRLHPNNAATLFGLVQQAGASNTTIIVSGESRNAPAVVARRSRYVEPVFERPIRIYRGGRPAYDDDGFDGFIPSRWR